MKFIATEVSADYDEYDILVIFLGNDDHYFMIQYEEEHDDQDKEHGMDTYHIERDDQSYGGYGGVEGWELKEDSLLIEFDEKGRKNLKTERLDIKFDIDSDLLKDLKEKLQIALT